MSCVLTTVCAGYEARFAEFSFEPGFAAAVDQHAAEIRDRLGARSAGLEPAAPDREALADYALGFVDALTEIDWREPVAYDYAVCRLTALTYLVRRHRLVAPRRGTP
ncbi:DUF6401 family natural product biosynthesis protein [Streptomyces sp. NPDC088745]|uniref:DUF6401 family natural product biosynthesis protein n=1 Tax=Streptomyces sp. NPDC088745 TaxID=3365884 RepID=UPI003826D415